MTTSKIQMQNALATLSTTFGLLYEELPHPCGSQGPEEIYAISAKAQIAALIILANDL